MIQDGWSDLVGHALRGTDADPNTARIEEIVGPVPEGDPARSLLLGLAYAGAARRAGRRPMAVEPSIEPAPANDPPVVPDRAAALLPDVLSGDFRECFPEWLRLARGMRVPEALLPALLDYGAGNINAWEEIDAVLGARGRWLAGMRPEWAAFSALDPTTLWESGNRGVRLIALRRLRRDDPAAARRLLEDVWKDESAEARADYLGEFFRNLSLDDEPFLEQTLDSRAVGVRKAGVALLATLPESALARRAFEHLRPLVSFRNGKLRVEPPEKVTPEMIRDGIEAPRKGATEDPIYQLVALVPPQRWLDEWKTTPERAVAATEKVQAFRRGIFEAVARYRAADWAGEVLRLTELPRWDLFSLLPPAEQDRTLADWIAHSKMKNAFAVIRTPLTRFGPLATRAFETHLRKQLKDKAYGPDFGNLLGQLTQVGSCLDLTAARPLIYQPPDLSDLIVWAQRTTGKFLDFMRFRVQLSQAFREEVSQ